MLCKLNIKINIILSTLKTIPLTPFPRFQMKLHSIKSDVWQSLCVLTLLLMLPSCLGITTTLLLGKYTRWPFIIGYFCWVIYDERVPWWEKKKPKWKRLKWFTEGIRGYFSGAAIEFLDRESLKEGPMIFGCHPHGIFGLNTLINMAIDSELFEEILGCPIHVLTLRLSFLVPIWRDILVRFGLGPVDGVTCRRVLRDAKHCIAVVLGVAREALHSRPGNYELILEKRKGIFREENKPIVPVFSFGDVDLYNQITLPWPLNLLQGLSVKLFGFSLPFPSGRFGTLLPFRRKLWMVVGRPIYPNGKSVDELHSAYKQQLIEIFDRAKIKEKLVIN